MGSALLAVAVITAAILVPGALLVAPSRGDLWLTDPFTDAVASVHVTCAV